MVAGRDKTGRFLGIPYDWRKPTLGRLKRGVWDPEQRRRLIPKVYGWGYGINLYEVARRLHLAKDPNRGA
jgi:hypothetical protein